MKIQRSPSMVRLLVWFILFRHLFHSKKRGRSSKHNEETMVGDVLKNKLTLYSNKPVYSSVS